MHKGFGKKSLKPTKKSVSSPNDLIVLGLELFASSVDVFCEFFEWYYEVSELEPELLDLDLYSSFYKSNSALLNSWIQAGIYPVFVKLGSYLHTLSWHCYEGSKSSKPISQIYAFASGVECFNYLLKSVAILTHECAASLSEAFYGSDDNSLYYSHCLDTDDFREYLNFQKELTPKSFARYWLSRELTLYSI